MGSCSSRAQHRLQVSDSHRHGVELGVSHAENRPRKSSLGSEYRSPVPVATGLARHWHIPLSCSSHEPTQQGGRTLGGATHTQNQAAHSSPEQGKIPKRREPPA